jgi:hypothetical protein
MAPYVDFQVKLGNLTKYIHAIDGEDNGKKVNRHISGPGSLSESHLSSATPRNSIRTLASLQRADKIASRMRDRRKCC